jgi:hypothetical protein
MNRNIGLIDNLKNVRTPEGDCDVCCSGEGTYDEPAGLLTLRLDAFLRTRDIAHAERQFRPAWLPSAQSAEERVSRDEASDLARELFNRWVKKVRDVITELAIVPA